MRGGGGRGIMGVGSVFITTGENGRVTNKTVLGLFSIQLHGVTGFRAALVPRLFYCKWGREKSLQDFHLFSSVFTIKAEGEQVGWKRETLCLPFYSFLSGVCLHWVS